MREMITKEGCLQELYLYINGEMFNCQSQSADYNDAAGGVDC